MSLVDYLGDSVINEYYGVYFSVVDDADQYRNEIGKCYEYLKDEVDSYNEEDSERQNKEECIIRYSPSKIKEESEKNIMLDLLNEYLL